ncbi:MAG TPA: secretin N-terminal domain-containing protein, partial [bacterium]|nr:secretin N-terminal domain-containing protein [bacterium]
TVLSNLASGIPGARGGTGARPGAPAAGGFPAQPQPAAGAAGAGGAVAVLSGDVKITSDKSTNALVITANKSDYEAIKTVIKQLDIRRRQVYVEAVIMEMTINKSRDIGLSFGSGIDAGRGAIGYGGLNAGNALFPDITKLATGFALGLLGPGGVNFTIPATTAGGTPTTVKIPPFGVVLNALENDSDINVLSRPNVLAKENEEAEVIVATSVAVPGNVTISQTGLQNFSITHEDVGITLKVTPKINESDHLSLNIFQEVKSIVNDQTIGNQRLVDTGKRSAKTSVVVKSGQTVVIGGLLSDSDTRSETKVPILGDIPLLGWLFRDQKHTGAKQNLVIFLTPTIINEDSDMEMIYQRRMKEREEFLRLYGNRALTKESKRTESLFERYWKNEGKGDAKDGKGDAKVEKGNGQLFEPAHPATAPATAPGDTNTNTNANTNTAAPPVPPPPPPAPKDDNAVPPPAEPTEPKEPAAP